MHKVCHATKSVDFALVYLFSEWQMSGLSAPNITDLDFASFEDRFSSWSSVHLCLTCVRVRKECSVEKNCCCQAVISARARCPSLYWWFGARTQTLMQLAVGCFSLRQSRSLCGHKTSNAMSESLKRLNFKRLSVGLVTETSPCYATSIWTFVKRTFWYVVNEPLCRMVWFCASSAHSPHQQATSWRFEQICHCLLVRSERLKGNCGQTKIPLTFLFVLLSSVCSVCWHTGGNRLVARNAEGTQLDDQPYQYNWGGSCCQRDWLHRSLSQSLRLGGVRSPCPESKRRHPSTAQRGGSRHDRRLRTSGKSD